LASSDPSSAKQGLTPAVLRLVVRNGAVAAITVGARRSAGGGVQGTTPRLLVLDAFTGLTLVSKELSRTRSPEKCELLAAGPHLVLALPPAANAKAWTLLCYEPGTGKQLWKTGGRAGPAGKSFDRIMPAGDKIIAALGPTEIVAATQADGEIAWRVDTGGPVRRLIPGEGKLFVAYDKQAGARAASYAIACVRTSDGKVLWDKILVRGMHLQPTDPIPFAAVSGGRLILVQHLMTGRGKHLGQPRIAVIRTSDGALLGMIGMDGDRGYNVHGGKWAPAGRLEDGVIGLITEAGLIGLSFEKE